MKLLSSQLKKYIRIQDVFAFLDDLHKNEITYSTLPLERYSRARAKNARLSRCISPFHHAKGIPSIHQTTIRVRNHSRQIYSAAQVPIRNQECWALMNKDVCTAFKDLNFIQRTIFQRHIQRHIISKAGN